MFRQSRSLTDRTGAVWWGVLWSGSLGHERFCLVRFGWAGSLQWTGEIGYETERERSGRNLQRFGEAWSHPVWQSRNGPDIFGGAG